MSKKHYEAIAKVLLDAKIQETTNWTMGHEAARLRIAHALARTFKADNDRFDSSRFLTAAGVPI